MQNPLGVVFGVDLTPCGAMSGHGTSASSRWLDGARADARDSVRSGWSPLNTEGHVARILRPDSGVASPVIMTCTSGRFGKRSVKG
jgi:hypothetical protein